MRRIIIGFFTVLGVLVVLLVVGGAITWHFVAPRTPAIAGSTILNLDLTQKLAKSPPENTLGQLLQEDHLTLHGSISGD